MPLVPNVTAPVLLPVPLDGLTPVVGVIAHVTVPPLPPVAVKLLLPLTLIAEGTDTEIALGVVHAPIGALTVCVTKLVLVVDGEQPAGLLLFVEVKRTV